jgi:hypothetical protein
MAPVFGVEFAAGFTFDFFDHKFWALTGFRLHLFLLSDFIIIT